MYENPSQGRRSEFSLTHRLIKPVLRGITLYAKVCLQFSSLLYHLTETKYDVDDSKTSPYDVLLFQVTVTSLKTIYTLNYERKTLVALSTEGNNITVWSSRDVGLLVAGGAQKLPGPHQTPSGKQNNWKGTI